MEFYSAIKGNEILISYIDNLENVLIEQSQSQKVTYLYEMYGISKSID